MNRRAAIRFLAHGMAAVPALAGLSLAQGIAFARERHSQLAHGVQSSVLDASQKRTILRIAEIILPETDTPGARALRLGEFIELLLTDSFLEPDRTEVLRGLDAIDQQCRLRYGSAFTQLTPTQQTAYLQQLDELAMAAMGGSHVVATADPKRLVATADPKRRGSAEQAFATLKWLTVYGYFTSEVVMKDLLHTIVIPGAFDGCVSRQQV